MFKYVNGEAEFAVFLKVIFLLQFRMVFYVLFQLITNLVLLIEYHRVKKSPNILRKIFFSIYGFIVSFHASLVKLYT